MNKSDLETDRKNWKLSHGKGSVYREINLYRRVQLDIALAAGRKIA